MSTSARPNPPTATATTTTTVDQLRADGALAGAASPTAADAPGWTLQKHCFGVFTTTATREDDVCRNVVPTTRPGGGEPGSYTSFQGAPGASLIVIIDVFHNHAEAETKFVDDTAPTVPSATASRLAVDQQSLYHIRISRSTGVFVTAPQVGDRSSAYRVTLIAGTRAINEDWVYVVRGRALVLLIASPPLRPDFETKLLGTVVNRLTFGNIAAVP